jgi:hypothetical protein
MRPILFITFVLSMLCSDLYGQDVTFSGYGATGIIFYDRNRLNNPRSETYYEGKFQADIDFTKDISGQLDFRGNSIDNNISFREFSVKFKCNDYLNIKAGNIKKPFGQEWLINREDLVTVNRSLVQEFMGDIGYGGRAVSIMAYKKSSKKNNLPISYYVSLFKDNSLNYGVVGRVTLLYGDYSYSLSYLHQNKGGDHPLQTHGYGADFEFEKGIYKSSLELFYVQDPVQGAIRMLQGRDKIVFSGGGRFLSVFEIKFDESIFKKIEPFLQLSFFHPDVDKVSDYIIQGLIGTDLYFHKKVRCRINGDLRLTKNEFNEKFISDESRIVFEIQAKF